MQREVSNIHFWNMQGTVEYKLHFHYTIPVVRTLKHHSSGLKHVRNLSVVEKFLFFFITSTQSWYFFFQVLRRIIGSMVPVYSKNYLVSFIRPNPDLYGKYFLLKINFTYSIQLL